MTGRRVAVASAVWLAAALAGLAVGPSRIRAMDALHALWSGPGADGLAAAVVWELRMPRVLVASLVGAALGAAGAVTQGLFRNPMAGPGVLGLGACAAFSATCAVALGLDAHGPMVVPAAAAAGVAVGLVLLLGVGRPGASPATLLLSGIALGAFASALSTLVLALSTEQWDLARKVLSWLMGSFESRSYDHVALAAGPVTAGIVLAWMLRGDLDVLTLGHEAALSLGVTPRRTGLFAVATVALLAGAATAVAGAIGFVGLVVPHLVRLRAGPRHGPLIVLSALWGAAGLVGVDAAARSLLAVSIPPGVATSLVGAPIFLWMLRRAARGWLA